MCCRYGRVPKPTQPLNYPSKEDTHSPASETTPSSPSASKSKTKSTGKRGKSSKPQSAQKSKKPKLVTLRSSKSDFSDEEDEDGQAEHPLTYSSYEGADSSLFLPSSLHSSNPEISEVDESMVEVRGAVSPLFCRTYAHHSLILFRHNFVFCVIVSLCMVLHHIF